MDRTPTHRCRVLYSGHVQGVGFRFNAVRRSASFDVVGFVKNLPDGRVELVAEGKKQEIERFLDSIQETMSERIREQLTDWLEPTGRYAQFEIRR